MSSSSGTIIHITALDGIINVNSLFTLAVFIGLTWSPSDPSNTLITEQDCLPGRSVAEYLVAFPAAQLPNILSPSQPLSCRISCRLPRLFFQLLPLLQPHCSMSQTRNTYLSEPHLSSCRVPCQDQQIVAPGRNVDICYQFCFWVCVSHAALINVAPIKLGTCGCGSSYTYAAVVPLVIFIPVALLIYISLVLYAFTR